MRRPAWREQLIGDAADLNRGVRHGDDETGHRPLLRPARGDAVLIDPLASNTAAHRFYQRLGFRFVERRRFGADDCHVYRLERADFPDDGPVRTS